MRFLIRFLILNDVLDEVLDSQEVLTQDLIKILILTEKKKSVRTERSLRPFGADAFNFVFVDTEHVCYPVNDGPQA